MRLLLIFLICIASLGGCDRPKETVIPKAIEKLETIKPALDKLTTEERALATGYILRQTMAEKLGGLFGGKAGPGIPEGMTIGNAIEEERKFVAERNSEEAKQAALAAKLQAEREAALKPMRSAVTVTLVAKEIVPKRGMSGMLLDEYLNVTFGYKNNTEKDIAGVKGLISLRDLFGDKISEFLVSNDSTIKAGESVTWTGSRSLQYSIGDNKDRKLGELTSDKYKLLWEPRIIVFSDGSKLAVPE